MMSGSSSTQVSSTSAEKPVGTSSVAQSDIAVLNISYDRGDDGWVEKPRGAEYMHSGGGCDGWGMDIGNGRRSAIAEVSALVCHCKCAVTGCSFLCAENNHWLLLAWQMDTVALCTRT